MCRALRGRRLGPSATRKVRDQVSRGLLQASELLSDELDHPPAQSRLAEREHHGGDRSTDHHCCVVEGCFSIDDAGRRLADGIGDGRQRLQQRVDRSDRVDDVISEYRERTTGD